MGRCFFINSTYKSMCMISYLCDLCLSAEKARCPVFDFMSNGEIIWCIKAFSWKGAVLTVTVKCHALVCVCDVAVWYCICSWLWSPRHAGWYRKTNWRKLEDSWPNIVHVGMCIHCTVCIRSVWGKTWAWWRCKNFSCVVGHESVPARYGSNTERSRSEFLLAALHLVWHWL